MQFVANMSLYRNTTVKGKSLADKTEVKGTDLMNISIFLLFSFSQTSYGFESGVSVSSSLRSYQIPHKTDKLDREFLQMTYK